MSAELYTEDQLQQKINEFQISDLYKQIAESHREMKDSYHHLDNKITGIYAVMAAFFIAWAFSSSHFFHEKVTVEPAIITQ